MALIDAGRPFPGVQTECVILIIQASRPTGQETCRLIAWDDMGQTVRAKVLEVDEDRRRIALSIKQLTTDPDYTGADSPDSEPQKPKTKRKKPLKGGLDW